MYVSTAVPSHLPPPHPHEPRPPQKRLKTPQNASTRLNMPQTTLCHDRLKNASKRFKTPQNASTRLKMPQTTLCQTRAGPKAGETKSGGTKVGGTKRGGTNVGGTKSGGTAGPRAGEQKDAQGSSSSLRVRSTGVLAWGGFVDAVLGIFFLSFTTPGKQSQNMRKGRLPPFGFVLIVAHFLFSVLVFFVFFGF